MFRTLAAGGGQDILAQFRGPLAAIVPESDQDKRPEGLTPQSRRRWIQNGVLDFLLAASKWRPIVLCIDDFSAADADSAQMIEQLRGRLITAGLRHSHPLLLCLALDDETPRYDEEQVATPRPGLLAIQLGPLRLDTTGELLESLLGPADGLSQAAECLYRESGGNPRFLMELIRHAAAQGAIVPSLQRWHISQRLLEQLSFPPNLDDMARQWPPAPPPKCSRWNGPLVSSISRCSLINGAANALPILSRYLPSSTEKQGICWR